MLLTNSFYDSRYQSSVNCIFFMLRNNVTCFPSKFIEKAFSESLNRFSSCDSLSLIGWLIKISRQALKIRFLFFHQWLPQNTINNAIKFYAESFSHRQKRGSWIDLVVNSYQCTQFRYGNSHCLSKMNFSFRFWSEYIKTLNACTTFIKCMILFSNVSKNM